MVSKKSGLLFERRLIEKVVKVRSWWDTRRKHLPISTTSGSLQPWRFSDAALSALGLSRNAAAHADGEPSLCISPHPQETGRCPVTDEALEQDDLVVVTSHAGVKPRPAAATSIPGLLSLFQNEWDATMLEAHQLRQALHASRQELSHALYQHDAATRVIGESKGEEPRPWCRPASTFCVVLRASELA